MNMIKLRENEEAVSPVIGVILMVAITVILAAVIAAFVFGMAGSVDTKNKMVAATASSHADSVADVKIISITYQGGADSEDVVAVNWSVNGSDSLFINGSETLCVGSNNITIGGKPAEKDHVVVTAKFKDGSSQVILDTHV